MHDTVSTDLSLVVASGSGLDTYGDSRSGVHLPWMFPDEAHRTGGYICFDGTVAVAHFLDAQVVAKRKRMSREKRRKSQKFPQHSVTTGNNSSTVLYFLLFPVQLMFGWGPEARLG